MSRLATCVSVSLLALIFGCFVAVLITSLIKERILLLLCFFKGMPMKGVSDDKPVINDDVQYRPVL